MRNGNPDGHAWAILPCQPGMQQRLCPMHMLVAVNALHLEPIEGTLGLGQEQISFGNQVLQKILEHPARGIIGH